MKMKFVQVQIRNNLGIMLFYVSQNSYFHDHNPSFRVSIIISSETSFIHCLVVPSRGPQMEGARPQGGLGPCTSSNPTSALTSSSHRNNNGSLLHAESARY